MKNIDVRTIVETNLFDFLIEQDFQVEEVIENVFKVQRTEELPVYMTIDSANIFFQVDLGSITGIENKELYFRLLDLNTGILPVSIGLDATNKEDVRLVIIESREVKDIDESELLYIFNALELATDKVEILLSEYLK